MFVVMEHAYPGRALLHGKPWDFLDRDRDNERLPILSRWRNMRRRVRSETDLPRTRRMSALWPSDRRGNAELLPG